MGTLGSSLHDRTKYSALMFEDMSLLSSQLKILDYSDYLNRKIRNKKNTENMKHSYSISHGVSFVDDLKILNNRETNRYGINDKNGNPIFVGTPIKISLKNNEIFLREVELQDNSYTFVHISINGFNGSLKLSVEEKNSVSFYISSNDPNPGPDTSYEKMFQACDKFCYITYDNWNFETLHMKIISYDDCILEFALKSISLQKKCKDSLQKSIKINHLISPPPPQKMKLNKNLRSSSFSGEVMPIPYMQRYFVEANNLISEIKNLDIYGENLFGSKFIVNKSLNFKDRYILETNMNEAIKRTNTFKVREIKDCIEQEKKKNQKVN